MPDISTSEVFADGETLTAARLNNIIATATILSAFFTGKASATPVSGDTLLFYQASAAAIKKCTNAQLLALLAANQTLSGTTNISQRFDLSGDITPPQITANQDDYNPTGLSTASTLRLASDASRNITGLQGGADGRVLLIHNIGAFNIVLVDASLSSSAVNRFALYHDLTIGPDSVVLLQYDGTVERWRSTASHTHTAADLIEDLTSAASVGFRGAPQNVQNAAYEFVLGDAGKHIFHDEATARIYTIPANSAVPFPVGTTIVIVNNNGAGVLTLAITTDTLRRADGTAGTGSRTIAADSMATILKTKATEWVIAGRFT